MFFYLLLFIFTEAEIYKKFKYQRKNNKLMQEKEGENPAIMSNFEIFKSNKVIVHVNPKIFPVSVENKTASLFRERAWVAIDGNEEDILVEIRPKQTADLELLARKFNNELLEQSTKEIKIDTKSDALISKIRAVVAEFVKEEQGKISKQSIVTIGAILATLGLTGIVSASHLCQPSDPYAGWNVGCGCGGCGGCEGGGCGGGCG